ncbi:glycoside hydrolase family 97 protein [Mucilaginibacter sp. HMF5004]|uniref:glycoside hydrolase family 97 protein n=1 Tax=Mucilaginibacter rivuli TaxID=2857527 RepID=UPI001C5EBC05|nr:glycoside hydrolase family 97 protein [Mucilaginibacter rivuli]MBW4891059.1 glycoside hydrolase family 97 protein [Mucilaginibacter rivuli]
MVFNAMCSDNKYDIHSPNAHLTVVLEVTPQSICYAITRDGQKALQSSKLGIVREDGDFSKDLILLSASPVSLITDFYQLSTIKRHNNTYKASKRIFHFKNPDGKLMDIIFQVSNDGVAFRYYFPGTSTDVKKITAELTSYHFSTDTKCWLQPMAEAKTGWAKANPSYEEYYQKEIIAGTSSPIKAGWIYPALFKTGNNWVLLTETFPTAGNYCGTHLKAESPDGEYQTALADPREVYTGGVSGPESKLPWYTPWRIITIGSLKTITESTLGTDVAAKAIKIDANMIKPGKASWSWVLLKDSKTTYPVQKQFIDYAADMHWQYCLIDALWDTQIGYDKIKELADYAKTKNVGLLLWYNSAGSWNETPQTPKDKMLTHESRVKEFGILKGMGIKGVKIDFFGGDGQSMMQYYLGILNDAKDYGLLVNFHGTTLPRGLERTYPNLVTMEAIKGMEFATFEQANMDEQPTHCTTIPFTRNVFDPMDYTPMALYKVPKMIRRTTSAFELALPVIFQSGIQHLAETPEGMSHVPSYVQGFLKQLPNYWDDIRFIDGYPGKLAVLARRSGNKWYIAGINGEAVDKMLDLDLSFLQGYPEGKLITDGVEPLTFAQAMLKADKHTQVKVKPNGGFVLVFEK